MRAVICGYYGQDNGGDEALLVTLLQLLPPGVEAIALSANPAMTSQRYGVKSVGNRDWGKILAVLRQSDVFIWGGGSLMQDVSSLASPFYYGGLMLLAQLLGLKTIAWAQGIGPLNHPVTQGLTRFVLGRCQGISVRDQASAQLLHRWRLDPLMAPDPVWLLASSPEPPTFPPSAVAVNLRRHRTLTGDRLQVLTQALIEFQRLTQTYLVLIPFQASQDLTIAEGILAQLPPQTGEIVQRGDPRDLKALFRGVSFTIGMRLHSLIMAASEGSPSFALSYDPKVSRLMAEVNLPGYELENLPSDPEVISQTWQDCYHQQKVLTRETRQALMEQTRQHQKVLASIVNYPN
ncbi:MAG: polysaccharide pyruvyl transferase CsaB [Microcystaceae cyanobacterium]